MAAVQHDVEDDVAHEDPDVVAEREEVARTSPYDVPILIAGLRKVRVSVPPQERTAVTTVLPTHTPTLVPGVRGRLRQGRQDRGEQL